MFREGFFQVSTLLDTATRLGPFGFAPPGSGGGGGPVREDAPWRLKKLFADLPVLQSTIFDDSEVRALITDSRRVVPGSVFFARDGTRTDGFHYAEEAIDRGAIAVVSTREPGVLRNVAHIQVANPAQTLAEVAHRFYRNPDRDLRLVGITGTNGKTTVSWLLQHILRVGKEPCGLIGTVHYDLGGRTIPSYRTTPESVDSLSMMAQMRRNGCATAVMEVSSHGIHQNRVWGFDFDCAVFLNLTRDHLDYHGTMENYFAVKRALFDGGIGARPPTAVVNADDPWGRQLVAGLGSTDGVTLFGTTPDAEVRSENPAFAPAGTTFDLVLGPWRGPVELPLPGRYNLSNALAAAATAWRLGVDPEGIASALGSFGTVPGRMEPVKAGQAATVFVDYAHTDDALLNALGMLREITTGRLLTVFGCGGNRDRSKRAPMTAAAQRYSDLAWATSDNPRGEDLNRIFDDMREGVSEPGRIRFVADRREAIAEALAFAREGDTLLVAGKGHETYQEYQDTVVPFDDRTVVRELVEERRGSGDARV